MRNLFLIAVVGVSIVASGCGKRGDAKANAKAAGGAVSQAVIDELSAAVYKFNSFNSRPPQSWQEMVDKKFLPSVPVAPAGKKFIWSPVDMRVSVVSATEDSETKQ